MALVSLLAISLFVVFVPAFNASQMGIVPDSVEYATAAWRLVNEGRYVITINGVSFPPRYPPGFALFALAPAYVLLGQNPGNAIFGVLFWSLIGISAAFYVGRRIGGVPGGLMAGALVLLLPDYRHYSQVIMSDVTCSAAVLVLMLAYLRLTDAPDIWRGWLGAGAMVALVTSIRPTGLSASIPFVFLAFSVRPRKLAMRNGLIFVLPVVLLALLHMTYSYRAIGSPFRSGYQFWCPVPYDYLNLTFGPSHVPLNILALWQSGFLVLIAVVVIMFLGMRRTARHDDQTLKTSHDGLRFIILTAAPLTVFHLFYFFGDSRFFLPATGLLAALAGAMGGAMLHRKSRRLATVAILTTLCLVCVLEYVRPAANPTRRLVVDRLDAILPERALLISHIDPVYLDFFLNRDAERVVLPTSRGVEYASKVAAPSRIPAPDPPPRSPIDHRCPGLLNGGGLDVFPATASEPAGIEIINEALASGLPVFLDATHLDQSEVSHIEKLSKRYRMRETAQRGLFRFVR